MEAIAYLLKEKNLQLKANALELLTFWHEKIKDASLIFNEDALLHVKLQNLHNEA